MKTVIKTLYFLFFTTPLLAQRIPDNTHNLNAANQQVNEIVDFLKRRIVADALEYCEPINPTNPNSIKLAGPISFQKKSREIFSTVVTANSDAVENGSAFAYVKDKDANTLSVNGAAFLGTHTLLDIGVLTKMQSTDYKFYAEKSWSNDVSGSVGFSFMTHITNKGDDRDTYSSKCLQMKDKRLAYIRDSIFSKYETLNTWRYDPVIFTDATYWRTSTFATELATAVANDDGLMKVFLASEYRIAELNETLNNNIRFAAGGAYVAPPTTKITVTETINDPSGVSRSTVTVDGTISEITVKNRTTSGSTVTETVTKTEPVRRDVKKELATAVEVRNTAVELLKLRDNEEGYRRSVQKYVERKIDNFDAKHDIFTGYSVSWISFKTHLTSSTITINKEDTINESVQQKVKDLFKMSIEASLNFSYSKKVFAYGKAYMKFNRGSLLDSRILKDSGFNVTPEIIAPDSTASYYSIRDDSGKLLANYDQLKHPVYNMDMGVFGALLPFSKKTWGFLGTINFNFPIKGVRVFYKPTYSMLGGLLMKAKKDGVVVQLLSGFEHQYHDRNAWDAFTVKASVGIPFTIFEKPKKP